MRGEHQSDGLVDRDPQPGVLAERFGQRVGPLALDAGDQHTVLGEPPPARVDAAAFEPLLDMTVLEALRATPAELAELCGEPPVRCSTLRAGLGALRQAVDDDYLRFLKLRALT